MKTRLLSLLLCTLMVLGCLTSCGTPSDPAQTTVATTVTEATTPAETEKPVEMLDQGGFARSGMADHADHLSCVDRKINVADRRLLKAGALRIGVGQAHRFND